MLQNPKYAIASMEDGLVDVIVMNLILKKAYEESCRKRYETAPLDFSASDKGGQSEEYICAPGDYGWSYKLDRHS